MTRTGDCAVVGGRLVPITDEVLETLAANTPSASVDPPSRPRKDDVRTDAVRAVAIAHGRGAGMSLLALFAFVLEEGIPSRAERERMLAERLSDSGDTTDSLGRRDTPDASA